jgi:hypothetical protein
MQKQTLSESNFDLWLLIGRVNHAIMLLRQKELGLHHVPVRQTLFLYTLDSLGPEATLSEVAKVMERKIGVISKQAIIMEKDGLIKRTQDTAYSAENGRLSATKTAGCPGQIGHPKLGVGGWGLGGVGLDLV